MMITREDPTGSHGINNVVLVANLSLGVCGRRMRRIRRRVCLGYITSDLETVRTAQQ